VFNDLITCYLRGVVTYFPWVCRLTTLIRIARSGSVTPEIEEVAEAEGISPNKLRSRIATGRVIIIRNVKADGVKGLGVGQGLFTKVNVNVGTSELVKDLDLELEKVRISKKYGADSIMDLSTGGDLDTIRRAVIKETRPLPLGTVPTYQAFIEAFRKKKGGAYFTEDELFNVVERHLKDGVDFMTIHAGITKDLGLKLIRSGRVIKIVSRGGDMILGWMLYNDSENPFYKNFDYLLEMFAEYDATISLGDALRPGGIADALDEFHIGELINNARLARRAIEYGVQVMIEGPGHVPLHLIKTDVKLMKRLSGGVPYYVLGPLPTDIAAPYDHIAAAAGASIAAAAGADLLCYLTPAEHLSLPTLEQVKEGLIATKIAAHIGDIVKYGPRAMKRDILVSKLRAEVNIAKTIPHLLIPEDAERVFKQFGVAPAKGCTMCGEYCPLMLLQEQAKKVLKEKK